MVVGCKKKLEGGNEASSSLEDGDGDGDGDGDDGDGDDLLMMMMLCDCHVRRRKQPLPRAILVHSEVNSLNLWG